MPNEQHWERVYSSKAVDAVSWYQPHALRSLQLIEDAGLARDAAIIDVGGGASTLVDGLLAQGYRQVTVLDLSAAALQAARQRLGALATAVTWLQADITCAELPAHGYELWHDRAVFHFLTEPGQRDAYLRTALHAIRPGGYLIVASFAEDGPLQCSGLPVQRYSGAELQAAFAADFDCLTLNREIHRTPMGTLQPFNYACLRRHPGAAPPQDAG
jgi:SAM-dependent methyltransferase